MGSASSSVGAAEGHVPNEGEDIDVDEGTYFDASHSGLSEIPSDAFVIPKLEKIMLQANVLHSIPEVNKSARTKLLVSLVLVTLCFSDR